MARVSANAAGEIIEFRASRNQETLNAVPPDAAYTLRFDEATNAGLIAAYEANAAQFAMPGGTLTQNGTPATVNPDDLFYSAYRNSAAMLSKARDTADPFTRAEVAQVLAVAFRGAGLG